MLVLLALAADAAVFETLGAVDAAVAIVGPATAAAAAAAAAAAIVCGWVASNTRAAGTIIGPFAEGNLNAVAFDTSAGAAVGTAVVALALPKAKLLASPSAGISIAASVSSLATALSSMDAVSNSPCASGVVAACAVVCSWAFFAAAAAACAADAAAAAVSNINCFCFWISAVDGNGANCGLALLVAWAKSSMCAGNAAKVAAAAAVGVGAGDGDGKLRSMPSSCWNNFSLPVSFDSCDDGCEPSEAAAPPPLLLLAPPPRVCAVGNEDDAALLLSSSSSVALPWS